MNRDSTCLVLLQLAHVPVVTFIYDNRFCEICQGGQFVLCPPQEVSPMHRLATNSLTGNWKPGGSNAPAPGLV